MARRIVTLNPEKGRTPRIEVSGLTKRFGTVTACDGISLTVRRGTIHAVVGENGAGKTTLMRCVSGLQGADEGELRFDGELAKVTTVEAARSLGVGMVHQEFSVIDDLTLAENLVLGIEPTKRLVLDAAAVDQATAALDDRTGWALPWQQPASKVGVSDLGRFELVRQLHRGADLLILDEPTAVLGPAAVDQLLATMLELRDSGHTLVFITHKLDEVMRVADDITVLKAAKVVWNGSASETDVPTLARAMVGSELAKLDTGARQPPSEDLALHIRDLTVMDDRGRVRLDGVSLDLFRGEILGVYGVAGSGQRPLVEALLGLVPADGSVQIGDREVSGYGSAKRRRAGLSFISPDRRNEGLAASEPVLLNAVAGHQRREGFARRGIATMDRWLSHLDRIQDRYRVITAGPAVPASSLSGGNQQRLVVGRELEGDPTVLVASDPTRGVDIAGVADIHRFLLDLRSRQGSVLLVSHELTEVVELSDRIAVLLDGKVVGILERHEASRASISELMTTGRSS